MILEIFNQLIILYEIKGHKSVTHYMSSTNIPKVKCKVTQAVVIIIIKDIYIAQNCRGPLMPSSLVTQVMKIQ